MGRNLYSDVFEVIDQIEDLLVVISTTLKNENCPTAEKTGFKDFLLLDRVTTVKSFFLKDFQA